MVICVIVRHVGLQRGELRRRLHLRRRVFTTAMRHSGRGRVQVRHRGFFAGTTRRLHAPLALVLSPLRRLLKAIHPSSAICAGLTTVCHGKASLRALISRLLCIRGVRTNVVGLQVSGISVIMLTGRVASPFRRLTRARKVGFAIRSLGRPLLL